MQFIFILLGRKSEMLIPVNIDTNRNVMNTIIASNINTYNITLLLTPQ